MTFKIKNMAVVLAAAAVMSLGTVCHAADNDFSSNIGVDRVAHFGVSYVICDQLHRNCGMNEFWAAVTTIAIGAAKEKWIDNNWDSGDFAADCAGAMFCVTF